MTQNTSSHAQWDLIFDGDDTLWTCSPVYQAIDQACVQVINQSLPDGQQANLAVLREARHRHQAGAHRRHGFSLDLFPNAWVAAYVSFAQAKGLTPDRLVERRLLEVAWRFFDADYPIFPGAISALEDLQGLGHRLHMLTLGEDGLQRRKVREAGLNQLFSSDDVHVIQTTKGPAMRLIGMRGRPGRVAMAGDSITGDVIPALHQGFVALWVKNEHPTWMGNKPLPSTGQLITIDHVRDIPKALELVHA